VKTTHLFLLCSILATGLGLILYQSTIRAIVLGIAMALGVTLAIDASQQQQ